MKLIIIFITALFSTQVKAGELYYKGLCILCVDELSMEFAQIENKRDPYFPEHDVKGEWKNGLAVNWDVRVLERLYWQNRAYFDTDTAVRHIGWKYELGIDLGSHIDIFWQHHSQHIAEGVAPGVDPKDFPLDDRVGIRLYFINNRNKK